MSVNSKSYPIFISLIACSLITHGYNLDDRYCLNGEKLIDYCLHSQSGLCKPTNQSLPCIGNDAWNAKVENGDATSCTLDYMSGKECASSEWPIYAYNAQLPPFKLTVYRHHTWMTAPALSLNLSLATDVPTGVKFFFEHQSDPKRRLCRKFTIENSDGYFMEEYDDEFYGQSENLPKKAMTSQLPKSTNPDTSSEKASKQELVANEELTSKNIVYKMSENNKNPSNISSTKNISNNSTDDFEMNESIINMPSANRSIIILDSPEVSDSQRRKRHEEFHNLSEPVYSQRQTLLQQQSFFGSVTPNTSSLRHTRTKRRALPLPPVLFWDCPMFSHGLEGQDFFLRLSDDAGWGAHLSFTVPQIDRHDFVSTELSQWWVFHYVHLEHVTLESSIPVTIQPAPFANLMYNVSLRSVCCVEDEASDDNPANESSAVGHKKRSLEATRKSGETSKDGCELCGVALASIILTGIDEWDAASPSPRLLLSTSLPYTDEVGQYAVTVQILSPLCSSSGCFVAVSPIFSVAGAAYGGWVVVAAVTLLVLFLLSFVVMALVIRAQAEVVSKKLWCRPRVLLVCCPHSPSSLSLITTISSFLHHSAAITTTTIHTHLADADPYLWMQYEMRTANKVIFLVPPKGQTVAVSSPVAQQWRLGVLCYASTYGALAPSDVQASAGDARSRVCCCCSRAAAPGQRDKDKFALVTLDCSGPVPAEISHLQRFYLLDDIVSLVTWLHDGTFLDHWFLWRPLMRRSAAGSPPSGTPCRRRRKKSSLIWTCRRDRDAPDMNARDKTESDVEDGQGSCLENGQADPNGLPGEEGKVGKQRNEVRTPELPMAVSNVGLSNNRSQSAAPRSQSMDSTSLNSSLCLRIEESACGDASQEQSLVNPNTCQQERPDWVDEVLNSTETGGNCSDKRANLPVTQYHSSPSLLQLKEAAAQVEIERNKVLKDKRNYVHASQSTIPSNSRVSWFRRLFFKNKSKQQARKPILEDTEELSLYDNSMVSNSGVGKVREEMQRWNEGRERPHCLSDSNGISDSVSPSKVSANTLCGLSNEETFSASGYDHGRGDPTNTGSFDGMPSVSELPLLGEDIVASHSPEASSYPIEKDDDDFTAMLFGGTVVSE